MRLSDDARKLVAFLGFRVMDEKGREDFKFGGSGFFVNHDGYPYLVTAAHVAKRLGSAFVVAVNAKTGNLAVAEVGQAEWIFHDNENVDVAILPLGLNEAADWLCLASKDFVRSGRPPSSQGAKRSIGVGDLVYIIGLYRLFPGKERASPIVHTGHIAMMPDEPIPIKDRNTGHLLRVEGYLIEAQTLEGLSGAPVLARYTVHTPELPDSMLMMSRRVSLLGVWIGSWDSLVGDILREELGRDARVPVGVGIMLPADRIAEMLDYDAARMQRQRHRDTVAAQRAKSQDSP